jgi:Tfp pilus assembly protein PilF
MNRATQPVVIKQTIAERFTLPFLMRSVCWTLLVIVVCTLFAGCRSFRQQKHQQAELTTARQFSLRGADALQQQKYDVAEALFSESLRHSPTDERAHWGLAEVLYHRGDCQAAATHLQEASRTSGNNPDLLVRLGEMQMEEGKSEQAMVQADMALAVDWQHARAWELRGRVLESRSQWQEAQEAYHRSLMSQPNNPSVQIALAKIYQVSGRPQRALATLERMSDLQNPQYNAASTWALKGAALVSLGQFEESRVCLREASQRATNKDQQVFLQVAQLQAELGDLADARVNLGRVLSQDPNNPVALNVQQQLEQMFRQLPAASETVATTEKSNIITTSGGKGLPTNPLPNSFIGNPGGVRPSN